MLLNFEGLAGDAPALLELWIVAPMSLPPSPDPKAGLLGLRLKSLLSGFTNNGSTPIRCTGTADLLEGLHQDG